MVERLAGHEYYYFLDRYSGYNQVPIIRSDCRLWKVWLNTENLALVGGNPHSFPCHLILFICFIFVVFFRTSVCHSSLEERSPMLHPTCVAHSVLYFWSHWKQCVILVWGWGRHFYMY